jgi:hypothetical protein
VNPRLVQAALVALLALALSACGSSKTGSSSAPASPPAPSAADFPSPKGKSMLQIYRQIGGGGPVLAPTVEDLNPGKNRYGFALFTAARKQIADIPVALYVERQGSAHVSGPFPARAESLQVAPPYRSKTVQQDPDAAKSLYVTQLPFRKPGAYAVMAVGKLDGRLVVTSPTRAQVLAHDPVPNVGDKAPVVDTPTVASAGGDISSIDTRQPPDDMHDTNLRDVIGKKPVILVFATPALCQSRVCGPVVDIAQEVKAENKSDDAAFIHMEIYQGNTIKPGCLEGTRPDNECVRPQFLAYKLHTEPWLFAIDRHGKVAARLEGAYSKDELLTALKAAEQG